MTNSLIILILQALDPNNSPGWDVQDQNTPQSNSKLPLFVKNVLVPQGPQEIQVTQCFFFVTP